MRAAFRVLTASIFTWLVVDSCFAQTSLLPNGDLKTLAAGHVQGDLTVNELASILGVTTWRMQIAVAAGHELTAGLVLLPEGSVYEPSKLTLGFKIFPVVGRRQVLFVVRKHDDGRVEITMMTAQDGSSSREFLPPRSADLSVTQRLEKIERLADKNVLMRVFDENGSAVAAVAYWFDHAER